MVRTHIESPKSIILCVIDVTRDLALHKIFGLLRTVDPEGIRTIVVFTKVDRCLQERSKLETILNQVQNKDFHPCTHYVFVNSLLADDAQEEVFFESVCREYPIGMEHCTFKNLYSKVCYMLLKPVMDEFRYSWEKVEEFRNNIIEEKNKLPMFTGDPTTMANRKLIEFIEASRETLKGNFSDNRAAPDLFSQYREFFRIFKGEYGHRMETMTRRQDSGEVVSLWRRQELANFHNWSNFKSFAQPIITSFLNPAIKCHNSIRSLNKEIIVNLVWETFDGQEDHIAFLLEKIDELFEEQEKILNERLQRVYECEKYFYSDDELYEKLLERYFADEQAPESKKSWKLLRKFLKKTPEVADALKKAPEVAAVVNAAEANADGASADEFMDAQDFTDQDIGNVFVNLDTHFQPTGSKHNIKKQMTYDVALRILKEIAMDRISNVVPSNILLCMNEEVQKKIQLIDRHSSEFCALEWKKSREEQRRDDLERQEHMIRKWRMDFLRVERQINVSVLN